MQRASLATLPGMTRASKRSTGAWIGMSVLLFLGWLMVVVGVHGVYLHSTLYNNEVFTKRVTSVLEQPGVQAAIATKLTNVVIEKVPDAIILATATCHGLTLATRNSRDFPLSLGGVVHPYSL